MLCAEINGSLEGYGGWINIGRLPEGFRPADKVFRATNTQEGNTYIIFQIHTDGTLYIHNFSKEVNGELLIDTITYICA